MCIRDRYDSRLGRRWNIDPVVKYHESPYATFANTPIWITDRTGADSTFYSKGREGKLESMKIFGDKGKTNELFYKPENGNCNYKGDKYIGYVSQTSLKGHEEFKDGTDDVLVKGF